MSQKTKVIGITGGVGSGKSHVCKLITKHLGYPVIDSDSISRNQMQKGSPVLDSVIENFGEDILSEDGSLDRGALAAIVFQDSEKLELLNSITHPAVIAEIQRQIETFSLQGIPYVFVESALACSAGYRAFCDEIWMVYASEQVRRYRLIKTRGYDDERISSLFSQQLSEEEMRACCDKVIQNGNMVGDLEICYQIENLLGL